MKDPKSMFDSYWKKGSVGQFEPGTGPGIYAVFLRPGVSLPMIEPASDGLLYVGRAKNLFQRMVETHFKSGATGFSVLRRTLGALLKQELALFAIPRSKNSSQRMFKFTPTGEQSLTEWMKANLEISTHSTDDPEVLEKELIKTLKPTLNRQGWDNPLTAKIDEYLVICRKQATMATKLVPGSDRGYPDLHDHIERLRDAGLLIVVDREINKDTQMHPLVRWQFRGGIAEEDRKAFLFTNIVDSKGRKYDIPVLVCGLAGNRAIYQMGLGAPMDRIKETWIHALNNPIEPNIVSDPACHQLVFEGDDLLNGNGVDALPVPISTPGWDNAPYFSSSHFITKDPLTGVQNMGNYRAMVKAPNRVGMNTSIELRTGGYMHWLEWKKRGEPMPCAIIVGAPPCVSFTAVQKMPEKLDELWVSGGLTGSALNVTRAKTVDLMVPAEAEVVIEGFVSTEFLEPEAPFGESHGHVNLQEYNGYMDVTCITRRKDAVLTSWVSQVTPSESSAIKRPAYEAAQMEHLRDHLGIKGVIHVATHEPLTSLHKLIIIQFESDTPRTEIWRALYGVASLRRAEGKWVIAVNEDIDPDNTDAVFWAMSYRCKPHRDVEILKHKDEGHGPRSLIDSEDGAVLVDATLKETYPPVSLPKREFMEQAKEIWEDMGLPKLNPERPWFGYDLGEWNEDLEVMARRAVRSEYWDTGKIIAQRRRNDLAMNTEVRTLDERTPGAGDGKNETGDLTWDGLKDASR